MCYLGIDKAIEDPSVCLRALPAVLVAPIIYPFALARGIAGVGAKGFPGAWSATQKLSRRHFWKLHCPAQVWAWLWTGIATFRPVPRRGTLWLSVKDDGTEFGRFILTGCLTLRDNRSPGRRASAKEAV